MTEATRHVAVASLDADWDEVAEFALSINGYEDPAFADSSEVGRLANAANARWDDNGTLPEDLTQLRGILFYEQRRTRMGMAFDFNPFEEWKNPSPDYRTWNAYIGALVEKIRELSGGNVEVRDPRWGRWDEEQATGHRKP